MCIVCFLQLSQFLYILSGYPVCRHSHRIEYADSLNEKWIIAFSSGCRPTRRKSENRTAQKFSHCVCAWMKWEWKLFDWLCMWIFWINYRFFARVSRNAWLLAVSLCLHLHGSFTQIALFQCLNIVCFMFSRFFQFRSTSLLVCIPLANEQEKKRFRSSWRNTTSQWVVIDSSVVRINMLSVCLDWLIWKFRLYIEFLCGFFFKLQNSKFRLLIDLV